VVSRAQLLDFGLATGAIAHRLRSGRLHRVHHGVYVVGRPDLSRAGHWTAAVMSCGPNAVLSHRSAAVLHGMITVTRERIEVTVPPASARRRPGLRIYRRIVETVECTAVDNVPVTTAERTLLDLAPLLSRKRLEAAVNAADKHDLVDPEQLRAALARYAGQRGVVKLRQLLDRHTYTLTASELEREFLPIAYDAGLGRPLTGEWVNGFEVDFHWPHLGLVVETDGLRYHRTPATQARDRLRDQTHAAAGLTTLRFTHAQVHYERRHVRDTLAAVGRRLRRSPAE
jgi:putative AbiEi antitoxin of type IV toxin-antitoxin system/transcriptional regulator with AbiEi antitoxin domain of type IV toxin-antitoxin system/uncharacterized protein DUF559